MPLVADASSDIFSRPIDVAQFGLIYAGAQKNLGPSGVTLVIIRDDLVARSHADLPTMLSYKVQSENNSLYNTPNTFGVYILALTMKWLKSLGGLAADARHERAQGRDALRRDRSDRVLSRDGAEGSRSLMNVTFRLPSEELEKVFEKRGDRPGSTASRVTGWSAACAPRSTTRFRRKAWTRSCSSCGSSNARRDDVT